MIDRDGIERYLVKKLKETQEMLAASLTIHQHFEDKREGCVVRDKMCILRNEGIAAAGRTGWRRRKVTTLMNIDE